MNLIAYTMVCIINVIILYSCVKTAYNSGYKKGARAVLHQWQSFNEKYGVDDEER